MADNRPAVEPGQRWACTGRWGEWRYMTVLSVDGPVVTVRHHRSGRVTTWRSGRFGRGIRFTFCGYDGPGVLPPFTGTHYGGCFNCGPTAAFLPLEARLEPGFGAATVTCDGEKVWSCVAYSEKRLAHMELRARDREGDWRLRLETPLREALYQRQGRDRWVLVAVGMGFA